MSEGVDTFIRLLTDGLPSRRIIRLGDSHSGGTTEHISVALNATEFAATDGIQAAVIAEDIAVVAWSDASIAQAWSLHREAEEVLLAAGIPIAPIGRGEMAESTFDGGWRGVECIYRAWHQ